MNDALDASEQALFNFDTLALHTQFLQMIKDNQGVSGDVPYVVPAPAPRAPKSCNDIAWTSAYPQILNTLHTYYGDDRLVSRHWPSLVAYQENLLRNATTNPNSIAECDGFGDWLCGNGTTLAGRYGCCVTLPGPAGSRCPVKPVMGSFNYVLGLRAMAAMAATIDNISFAVRYNTSAAVATAGFHKAFWSLEHGEYGGDLGATQSLTAPALFIGAPPAALLPKVVQTLQTNLAQTTGYNPFVGSVTSKILLNVLSDNGLHETALKTATRNTVPSWGFWWTQNSSTCWESWPLGDGHGSGTVNHIFLCGGIGEWMWKHLVGLTPAAPQFAEVTIHPKVHPVEGPAKVSSTFKSPRGPISSGWMLSDAGAGLGSIVELNVSLPIGVQRATLVVPKPFMKVANTGTSTGHFVVATNLVVVESGVKVWDGTKLVGNRPGITAAVEVGDGIAFEVTNGAYQFVSSLRVKSSCEFSIDKDCLLSR